MTRNRAWNILVAGLAGLIAIGAGAALAIAPVNVKSVEVTWPDRADDVRSTSLLLANQTPHVLDLRFSASVIRSARAAQGVVFATVDPSNPDAIAQGLVVAPQADGVLIRSQGRELQSGSDEGDWLVHSDVDGTTISRDGRELAHWTQALPPQIDAIFTSVTRAPSVSDLQARIQVVDDADDVPSPLKIGLMVIMWFALIVSLTALWRDQRAVRVTSPPRRGMWRSWLLGLDALVVLAFVAWIFIGPMTDDDGYYANMANNFASGGYVGNYFQLFNQSFTPFTWFWQFLAGWQELGGRSPVWLRVPALIAAITSWFITSRLLSRQLADSGRARRAGGVLLLALVFVGWWSAYAIGSRPEILGASCGVAALALMLRARQTNSLIPAAAGASLAGIAFAAHPTGVVAFAPVLLSIPALWRMARTGVSVRLAVMRALAVLSVGSVTLFAAFVDASLNDGIVGSARFSAVETPQDWTDEINRYSFLFQDVPMGSYAKRAVVLVALVALVWFLVLAAVCWRRVGVEMSRVLQLTGFSLLLSFVLLWITPSKWTHHFGALSSIGALLIALMAIEGPRLARAALGEQRAPVWLAPLVCASFVPAMVFALMGPNSWAYAWQQGMPSSFAMPGVGALKFGSLPLWIGISVVLLVVTAIVLRRGTQALEPATGPRWLAAASALLMVFFTLSTGYLYGSFALASARTLSSYSTGAANLLDPSGGQCLTDKAIRLWDASTATPLTTVTSEGAALRGFTPDGYPADDQPPAQASGLVGSWGAKVAASATTNWFDVPAVADTARLVVLVAGELTTSSPNTLRAEFGHAIGNGSTVVDWTADLHDSADRPGWRSIGIPLPPDRAKSDRIRLIGTDGETASDNWLGFGTPALSAGETLFQRMPADAPTSVSWTSTFWFPCDRPTRIHDGIIEPPVMATTFGEAPPDNIWQDFRGGLLAGVTRLARENTPYSEMSGVGGSWGRVVFFDYPVAKQAYRVSTSWVETPGWRSPFAEASQLVVFQRGH